MWCLNTWGTTTTRLWGFAIEPEAIFCYTNEDDWIRISLLVTVLYISLLRLTAQNYMLLQPFLMNPQMPMCELDQTNNVSTPTGDKPQRLCTWDYFTVSKHKWRPFVSQYQMNSSPQVQFLHQKPPRVSPHIKEALHFVKCKAVNGKSKKQLN